MVQFDVNSVQSNNQSIRVTFDFPKASIVKIVDYVIAAAAMYQASEIIFNPKDEGIMVSFNINNVYYDYVFIPKEYKKNFIMRIKIIASMNFNETHKQQDRNITETFWGYIVDMHISAIPLDNGEKIIIKILNTQRG